MKILDYQFDYLVNRELHNSVINFVLQTLEGSCFLWTLKPSDTLSYRYLYRGEYHWFPVKII